MFDERTAREIIRTSFTRQGPARISNIRFMLHSTMERVMNNIASFKTQHARKARKQQASVVYHMRYYNEPFTASIWCWPGSLLCKFYNPQVYNPKRMTGLPSNNNRGDK